MLFKCAAGVAGRVGRCAIVVLAFGPACAGLAFGQSIAPKKETRDAGSCTGVISAIGDTLAVSKFGFFGNEESKVPIDTWRIDDLVFSRISAVLGSHSNLKRVSVSKGAFAVLEGDHNPLYNSTDDVKAILGRIATTTRCDRYIVVMKTTVNFKNSQRLDGLGILSQGDGYSAWAEFTINLYDGQNFSLLGKHPAVTGKKNFLGVDVKPYRKVDQTWWPAGATPTPAARDGFRSLVMESLEATVPKLLND